MAVGVAESRSSRESSVGGARNPSGEEGARRIGWVIDRVLDEYAEHRAGRLNRLVLVDDRGQGEVNACGDESSAPWAATYVRYTDRAVMPLAVGGYRHVYELAGMLTDQDLTDESRWSPPRVLLDGAQRYFQPTYGRYLLGIARSGERVVMLVAIGEQVGVLLQDSPMSRPRVLFIGSALGFRELDVDGLAELHRPSTSSGHKAPRKRPVVTAATQVHHRRIALGEEFETGDGPAVPEVVQLCFEALAERTIDAARQGRVGRARGVSFVRQTLRAIYLLGLRGSLDPCGRISELHRQLSEADPGLGLGPSQLGNAIKLLERTGCCLIMRMSRRIWKIRVVGLSDPRSLLHRQLCKETGGRFFFSRASNSWPGGAEPRPRSPFGGSAAERGADARSRGAPSVSCEPRAAGDTSQVGENLAEMGELYKQMAKVTAERDELRSERDELRGRVVALEGRFGAAQQRRAPSSGGQASPRLESKAERGERDLAGTELPRSEVPLAEPPGDARGHSDPAMREMPAEAGVQGQGGHRKGEEGAGQSERARSEMSAESGVQEQGRHRQGEEGVGQPELVARLACAIKEVVVEVSELSGRASKVEAFRSRVADTRALVAEIKGTLISRDPADGPPRDAADAAPRGPDAGGVGVVDAEREQPRTRLSPIERFSAQGPPALRIRPCTTICAGVAELMCREPRGTADDKRGEERAEDDLTWSTGPRRPNSSPNLSQGKTEAENAASGEWANPRS